MTPTPRLTCAMLAAALTLAVGSALATPVPLSGEDPNAPYAVTPGSAPDLAQASFLSKLTSSSVLTEDFQDKGLGTGALTGLFGGLSNSSLAVVGGLSTGSVTDQQVEGGTVTGRFSTSPGCTADADGAGCNWWVASGSFTIAFGRQVSAFGFFGTDIGDFDGTLSISLIDDGVVLETLSVLGGNAAGVASTETSTSLLFYGFTDQTQSYDTIRFNITQRGTTTDWLGFDDMIIGDLATTNGVPEPTTLALVALSLAGLAASRRKTQG